MALYGKCTRLTATWCFSFGCWLVCREGAPASEGIVVEEPKQWCPICNMPDTDKAPCRCDYPTQEQLIELLRTIYADDTTTEKIKTLIEELFRP